MESVLKISSAGEKQVHKKKKEQINHIEHVIIVSYVDPYKLPWKRRKIINNDIFANQGPSDVPLSLDYVERTQRIFSTLA